MLSLNSERVIVNKLCWSRLYYSAWVHNLAVLTWILSSSTYCLIPYWINIKCNASIFFLFKDAIFMQIWNMYILSRQVNEFWQNIYCITPFKILECLYMSLENIHLLPVIIILPVLEFQIYISYLQIYISYLSYFI